MELQFCACCPEKAVTLNAPAKKGSSIKDVVSETGRPEIEVKDSLKQDQCFVGNISHLNIVDSKGNDRVTQGETSRHMNVSGGVNMEASITSDEIVKAGGFGARDDISNFLPVASDSTDFEASLRDARDYEEQEEIICRPGLGWTEARESAG